MNNKGQTIMIAALFSFLFFLFGIVFINFIMPEVINTQTNLSCSDLTISDGTKLMCLITDGVVPYFIILILSAAGGTIMAKISI